MLNTNGAANTVTWTVNDPAKKFDGRSYCASLVTVYTSSSLNQALDYDLAEADGLMGDSGTGAPNSRTLTIGGVNTASVTGATYYAGYTLGVTGQHDSLSFNGAALGANPNDVAQGSNANYGPSIVSSDVTNILSGANTVQYSVAMPGGQTYLRANIGLLTVTHPLTSGVWASAVSGSWSTASDWTGGVPNAVGAEATIDVSTTAALTITLNEPVTLGTLLLGNSGSTTVGYTLSGSGADTLTFSNSGNGATIAVADGSHVIDAPVVLADNLVVTDRGTLVFGSSSSVTDDGSHSLTMNGAGKLVLAGNGSLGGASDVSTGTLEVDGAWTTSVMNVNGGRPGVLGSGQLAGSGTITLTSDNLYYNSTATSNFAGRLASTSDNSGLEVNGGTLILSGDNTYQGGTDVAGGTLILASKNAFPQGTSLEIDPGGALIFDPAQAGSTLAEARDAAASPAPEPGTMALLIAGLAAGFAAGRRRKAMGEFDPEG